MMGDSFVHMVGVDGELRYVVGRPYAQASYGFDLDSYGQVFDCLADAVAFCQSRMEPACLYVGVGTPDSGWFVDVATSYLGHCCERPFGSSCNGAFDKHDVIRVGQDVARDEYLSGQCLRFAFSFALHICSEDTYVETDMWQNVFAHDGRYGHVARFADLCSFCGLNLCTEMHHGFDGARVCELARSGYVVIFSLEKGTRLPLVGGRAFVLDERHCVCLLETQDGFVLVDQTGARIVSEDDVIFFANVDFDMCGSSPWSDGFLICGLSKGDAMGRLVLSIRELCDFVVSVRDESAISLETGEVVRTDSSDKTRRDFTGLRNLSLDDPLLSVRIRGMCRDAAYFIAEHDAYFHVVPMGGDKISANIVDFGNQPQPQKTFSPIIVDFDEPKKSDDDYGYWFGG